MRGRVSILAMGALLVASLASAAPPTISGPTNVAVDQESRFLVDGLTPPDISGGLIALREWSTRLVVLVDCPEGARATVKPAIELGFGDNPVSVRLYFTASKPGVFVIAFADFNSSALTLRRVAVGPIAPEPKPEPKPVPSPAPIPLAGFRVLILEESAQRTSLPASQLSVLTSTEVRSYLRSKCATGANGPEFRFFDVDDELSAQEKHWSDAAKRPRTALPWLLISTGSDGFEGPLPATVSETLSLLKKYGG